MQAEHCHCTVCLVRFLCEMDAKLSETLCRLKSLEKQIMALADDLKAGIAQLDAETTAVAALITKLAGSIHNSMSDTEVTDIKTSLTTLSDRLTGLAVDPTNPVPTPSAALQALKAKK